MSGVISNLAALIYDLQSKFTVQDDIKNACGVD